MFLVSIFLSIHRDGVSLLFLLIAYPYMPPAGRYGNYWRASRLISLLQVHIFWMSYINTQKEI